jgi:hypothetical protein
MLTHHLLDSLAARPSCAARIADVGTGAGFPPRWRLSAQLEHAIDSPQKIRLLTRGARWIGNDGNPCAYRSVADAAAFDTASARGGVARGACSA